MPDPTMHSAPKGGHRGFNRIPGATYRLQFNRSFTLPQATKIIPYLKALGVTDVYASPLFEATPGSTHGYDVCHHGRISKELGGIEAFRKFSSTLRHHGMGLLVDIVPNHMAAHPANPWWWDVLKNGPHSNWAHCFDMDWTTPDGGRPKIVLPVLGGPLLDVLARGEIKAGKTETGEPVLTYYDQSFPVSPETSAALLEQCRSATTPSGCQGTFNSVLEKQHYRLMYWREGLAKINYRRFFDVASLVALRMEDDNVFHATHQFLFQLVEQGDVTGLRVDHPDGLKDPERYFTRLQEAFVDQTSSQVPLYVVGEKILSVGEELPTTWNVAGTTGYDFLNEVNSLFVFAESEQAMTRIYGDFAGVTDDFHEVAYCSRKQVLLSSFTRELEMLVENAHTLGRQINDDDKPTLDELRKAIVELIACWPNYRTYVQEETRQLSAADSATVRKAEMEARRRESGLGDAIGFVTSILALKAAISPAEQRSFTMRFQQLTGPVAAKGIEDTAFYNYHRLISLNEVGGDPARYGISVDNFHQQNLARAQAWPHSLLATATHDTKRGEDARARINVLSEMPEAWRDAVFRWSGMNEKHKQLVANIPAPDRNDEYLLYQTLIGAWPDELLPVENPLDRSMLEPRLAAFTQRIKAYMLKAVKEAKRHTSWTQTNEQYEQAILQFVEKGLSEDNHSFLEDFSSLAKTVSFFGAINSLAQLLLKLTSPGVPDIYQGTELWDFSLVDPDNRRAVDYAQRGRYLADAGRGPTISADTGDSPATITAMAKMLVVRKTLNARGTHQDLFEKGEYIPLEVEGQRAKHVCAFARARRDRTFITVCPRQTAILAGGARKLPCGPKTWRDVVLRLPSSSTTALQNVLTGETVTATADGLWPLRDILRTFPVALLTNA